MYNATKPKLNVIKNILKILGLNITIHGLLIFYVLLRLIMFLKKYNLKFKSKLIYNFTEIVAKFTLGLLIGKING